MKMASNMVDPLPGIKMVSSGSKNLITLVIPLENGKHGIKRVFYHQKFPMQRFLKGTLHTQSLINLLVT